MPVTPSLAQRFADRMGQLLGPDFPSELGLAVSGGGDSMAMLHLAAGWARLYGVALRVATVDHGLRAASAAEAQMVADEAAGLGLTHTTLKWQGWDGGGNLQDAARRARRDLIGTWTPPGGIVLMAHSCDDQAETLLMRLARGSGVDGLAAMEDRTAVDHWQILRPLLTESRADLRHYLKTLRIPYVDDPSNSDDRFARVRMRRLIGAEGLDIATLSATARRMARAKVALGRRAHDVAQALLVRDPTAPGAVVLAREGFALIEPETQLRVLAGALQYVSTATYRPRLEALESALDRMLGGGITTLHGGVILPKGPHVYIAREPERLAGQVTVADGAALWDQRWLVSGPEISGLQVRALTEQGLAQIPDLPMPRAPRLVLAGLPAIWRGASLIACAPLGFGPEHDLILRPPGGDFPTCLLAH